MQRKEREIKALDKEERQRRLAEIAQLTEVYNEVTKKLLTITLRPFDEKSQALEKKEFGEIKRLIDANTAKINELSTKLYAPTVPLEIKNKFVCLHIKQIALIGHYNINVKNSVDAIRSAIYSFDQVVEILAENLPSLVWEDSDFENAVCNALLKRMVSARTMAAGQSLAQVILHFCRKCSDNVAKLALLADMNLLALSAKEASEKNQLFWDSYKRLKSKLEEKLESQPGDFAAAIEYVMANKLAYQVDFSYQFTKMFKIELMNNSEIESLLMSANSREKDFHRFIKIDDRLLHEYIYPSLEVLAKANADNFNWSFVLLGLVRQLQALLSGFLLKTGSIFMAAASQMKRPGGFEFGDPLLVLASLAHTEITHKINDIVSHPVLASIFEKTMKDANPTVLGKMQQTLVEQSAQFGTEKMRDGLSSLKKLSLTYLANQQAQTKAVAEQSALFLLEREEKTKRRLQRYAIKKQKKVEAKERKQAKARTSPTIEEVEESSEDAAITTATTNHHLVKAFQDVGGERIASAIEKFQLAYQEACRTKNIGEQLDCLDALLSLNVHTVITSLKKFSCTIYSRKRTYEPLSEIQFREFHACIDASEKSEKILTDLDKKLYALSQASEILSLTDVTIMQRIVSMRAEIPKFIFEINNKIYALKKDFFELNELIDLRHDKFIIGLGIKAAIKEKRNGLKDDEYYQLGCQEYKRIGIEKAAKGEDVSAYTKERVSLQNLGRRLSSLHVAAPSVNLAVSEVTVTDQVALRYHVELPVYIKNLMHDMLKVTGQCYLIGSWALEILMQAMQLHRPSVATEYSDVDLIVDSACELRLPEFGFDHSMYHAKIYTRKSKPPVDCCLADMSKSDWLAQDQAGRDFSCSVYIDVNGDVYATKQAIADIKEGILRINGAPQARIEYDPVILLRAMRYLPAGFTPEAETAAAMHHFSAYKDRHQPHLHAVARKHLKRYGSLYVQLLHDHGLLKKLFGIDCEGKAVDDMVVWKLKKQVGLNFKDFNPKYDAFFKSEPAPVDSPAVTATIKAGF